MRQALCEIAVVCQEKQTFSLGVQPANVKQPRKFRRKQIKDRIADVRIFSGGNEPGRLVQHDSKRRRTANQFAIYFDMIAWLRLCAEICADRAVDRDSTRPDQFIATATRSHSRGGEETVEAHNRDSLTRESFSRFNDVTIHELHIGLGLRQTDDFLIVLPLAAFLQKLDALEAF